MKKPIKIKIKTEYSISSIWVKRSLSYSPVFFLCGVTNDDENEIRITGRKDKFDELTCKQILFPLFENEKMKSVYRLINNNQIHSKAVFCTRSKKLFWIDAKYSVDNKKAFPCYTSSEEVFKKY